MTRNSDAGAYLIIVMVLAGALVTYVSWARIVRLSADHVGEHAALWIEDANATPGSAINARVRTDGGVRTGIRGVIVDGAGERQTFYGSGVSWGTRWSATACARVQPIRSSSRLLFPRMLMSIRV